MKKKARYRTARSIISFLMILVAFGILLLFTVYQEEIMKCGNFNTFFSFTTMGMVLFVVLLYLVSQSSDKNK